MSCEKCKLELTNHEAIAKCVDCSLAFHVACAKNYKGRSKTWKCAACKDESASAASVKSADEAGEDRRLILEAINSVKTDLGSKIEGIRESIDSLKIDLKSLTEKVATIESDQVLLNTRCDKIERVDAERAEEIRDLRLQILDLEQHSRCANLEILGIPATEGENLSTLLNSLAGAIGVPYKNEDISIAHRLRLYSKKHVHPPIIVQFVSRIIKEMWLLASRRRKTLRASEVSSNFSASAVFVNEHLTPNKALLGRARRLYREKKVVFAGFVNGRVIVKHREGETAARVVLLHDLDKYEK
jgi:hypothetical protein